GGCRPATSRWYQQSHSSLSHLEAIKRGTCGRIGGLGGIGKRKATAGNMRDIAMQLLRARGEVIQGLVEGAHKISQGGISGHDSRLRRGKSRGHVQIAGERARVL